MTNPPFGTAPGGQWPPLGPPAGPPAGWPPVAAKQSRLPVIISLVVALIAVAVAIGAWFRPTPETPAVTNSAPQFTEQQVAEAKKGICDAHDLVNRASAYAGTQKSEDPTLEFIISVNIRLSGTAQGDYLLAVADKYPATSPPLDESVRELGLALQETTLLQLANAPQNELDTIYAKLDAADAKVVEACK
jgi:hypothetical protein